MQLGPQWRSGGPQRPLPSTFGCGMSVYFVQLAVAFPPSPTVASTLRLGAEPEPEPEPEPENGWGWLGAAGGTPGSRNAGSSASTELTLAKKTPSLPYVMLMVAVGH